MIDRCFNPSCRRALKYLRDGRIVRVLREKGDHTSVEHYWLCGPCFLTHDFEFLADGSVTLRERSGRDYSDHLHFDDVLLPERRSARRTKRARRSPDIDDRVA